MRAGAYTGEARKKLQTMRGNIFKFGWNGGAPLAEFNQRRLVLIIRAQMRIRDSARDAARVWIEHANAISSRCAAKQNMRPNWPPPSMPSQAVGRMGIRDSDMKALKL